MGEGCRDAACSISSGNAVSMNGPGILMPQCRGAGAAVWQAPEKHSDSLSSTKTQTKEDH